MPILGANFLQGHDVLFDTDNTRIGFVEADCAWTGPYDDPTPSPTVTPAPTITFAPTNSPTKHANNDAMVNVAVAVVLLLVSCCIGVSFAASCNALRKFRKDQAIARASRSPGAFDAGEGGVHGRVCRWTARMVDRCKCCPQSHQFDALGDDEDGMELPDKFSGGGGGGGRGDSEEREEGRSDTSQSLKSIAKSSIAHANKFLSAKRREEFQRPGEGLEF